MGSQGVAVLWTLEYRQAGVGSLWNHTTPDHPRTKIGVGGTGITIVKGVRPVPIWTGAPANVRLGPTAGEVPADVGPWSDSCSAGAGSSGSRSRTDRQAGFGSSWNRTTADGGPAGVGYSRNRTTADGDSAEVGYSRNWTTADRPAWVGFRGYLTASKRHSGPTSSENIGPRVRVQLEPVPYGTGLPRTGHLCRELFEGRFLAQQVQLSWSWFFERWLQQGSQLAARDEAHWDCACLGGTASVGAANLIIWPNSPDRNWQAARVHTLSLHTY